VASGETVRRDFVLGNAAGDAVKMAALVVAVDREMTAAALAINEQRFAPNTRMVVSTDEFGSVAESNIGEFLRFLPGLAVDYNMSNPREVSINGVPSDNVPVTLDGFSVASTASSATSRAVSLDFFALGNTSRIEVDFSPTPDSQGAALAGSVNLVPRSAFGRDRPLLNASLNVTMRDNTRDLRRTAGPRDRPTRKVRPGFDFNYLAPLSPRLGLSLTGGSSTQMSAQDLMAATWRGVSAPTNGTTFPHTTVDRPYLSQYILRVTGSQYERRSFGFGLEARLSPRDRLTFSYQWSSFSSNFMQRSVTFNVNRVIDFSPTRTVGGAGAGSLTMSAENGTDRLNRTHMPSLVWRHAGPVWQAEAGAGTSVAINRVRGVDKGFFNTYSAQRSGVTVSFDDIFYLRPGRIAVTDGATGAPVDAFDAATYALGSTSAQRRNLSDTKDTLYAKIRRDLPGEVPLSLRAGIDARRLTRDQRNHSMPYTYVGRDGRTSTSPAAGDDSAVPFLDLEFSRQDGPFGFPRIGWIGPEATWTGYLANPGHFTDNPPNAYRTRITGSRRTEELVSAAFLRADAHLLNRRLKLTSGLRAEQTNVEAHAVLTDPTLNYRRDPAGRVILGTNGRPVPITTEALEIARLTVLERAARTDKEFLTLFPSLNASYALTPDLVARAAVYRSIGRPNLTQYASGITLPDLELPPGPANRIEVSNAGLKPWTANSTRIRLEYYFEGVGQLSLSAFRRDFTNFYGGATLRVTPEFLSWYDLDPALYGEYEAVTQQNLPGTVRMSGLDLSYKQALTFLAGWARGVQVFANGSTLRATGPALANFSGLNNVPRTASWGVSLTRPRFNLRLNWNYRGRQREGLIAAAQGIEPSTYNWTAKRLTIDLLGEWYLRRGIAVFGNLRNLSDQPFDTKAAGPSTPAYAQFRTRAQNGAQWTFGMKGTF